MKNVLITGGLGFIGTNLVLHLQERGYNVVVLDNCVADVSLNPQLADHVIIGDIRDEEAVYKATQGIDAIVHLAAFPGVSDCENDPERARTVNVDGTEMVLERAKYLNVPFIFASSVGAVIGNQDMPAHEGQIPEPMSVYGKTKYIAEKKVLEHNRSIILRFTNVYGPYCDRKHSIIPELLRKAENGGDVVIYGDGSQTRDLVYVQDVCRAIVNALATLRSGMDIPSPVFHIGTGIDTSVNQMIEAVERVTEIRLNRVYKDRKEEDVQRNFTLINKAMMGLGYRPRILLDEGLRRTWSWLQSKIKAY